MLKTIRRAVRDGVEFGMCAGLVLILAEVVSSVILRQPIFSSLRYVVDTVFGRQVLQHLSATTFMPVGILFHLLSGGLFGILYGLLNAGLSDRTQTRWDRQAAIGLAFGALVWGVKWQLAARYFYPAVLQDRSFQFLQLALHTFFYGYPLALFYTTAERSLVPLRRALEQR